MKLHAKIHSIEHLENRSKVSFAIAGNHSDYVELFNKIVQIERVNNAQSTIYNNKSSLIFDEKGNVTGLSDGKSSGTITFHSHSCLPKQASESLIKLLTEL